MKSTKKQRIRSKTNLGEFAKQTFVLAWNTGEDTSLLIEKLVLIDDIGRVEKCKKHGFKVLKSFKGKTLCRQVFSIKLDTLHKITNWINTGNQ